MPIIYRNQTTTGRRSSSPINIYGTLRSLEVGECVELPAEAHDSVRSVASRLQFRGMKVSTHIERSGAVPVIIVTRES